MFLGIYLLAFHCKSFYYIYLDWEFYLTTFTGYLSLLYLLLNSFTTDFWLLWIGMIDSIISTTGLAFSLIFLLRLRQINALLKKKDFGKLDLYRFTYFHSQTLVHVLYVDRYFGSLLLGYTICIMPISAIIAMGLIRGQFALFSAFFFVSLLVFVYDGMIGFHFIASVYSSFLHKCRFQLLHWQVFITGDDRFSTRDRLHLQNYIQKVNVNKRYGITFRNVGLISFGSFTKFLLLYTELLLFSYRLF